MDLAACFTPTDCQSLWVTAAHFVKEGSTTKDEDQKRWVLQLIMEADFLLISSRRKIIIPEGHFFHISKKTVLNTYIFEHGKNVTLSAFYKIRHNINLKPNGHVLIVSKEKYPLELIMVRLSDRWYKEVYTTRFKMRNDAVIAEKKSKNAGIVPLPATCDLSDSEDEKCITPACRCIAHR